MIDNRLIFLYSYIMTYFKDYTAGFLKKNRGRIYIITRSFHGMWSLIVSPFALWFFLENGGSDSMAVLNTAAWLYAMTVIIHLEQYLYPVTLAGSLRLTGVIYLNIIYSAAMNESYYIYFGFYTTFLSAMAFVCLTVMVLIVSVLLSGWIRFPFFRDRIESFRDRIMILAAITLVCAPFFFGLADFSKPLQDLLLQQKYPYFNLALMSAQMVNTFIQFIRLMFYPDNDYSAEQKKYYTETWYPVSNMIFFVSMIASFIVLM